MTNSNTYLLFAAILFTIELIYFKIADHYNIIDKPNHRSSHSQITIRGGGIIFALGLLICPLFFGLLYAFFLAGLFLVALISFIDDIKPLNNKIRLSIHLMAAGLLIIQLNLLNISFYYLLPVLFFIIGTINAINFMDGINGITGIYALVALSTLYYLNTGTNFTDNSYLLTGIIAVIVFNFFNCRTKAKCFAGDVGSVSIAFIIVFFLLQLILKTQNINYVFLLLIYGLDTATTIFLRIIRKEKITEAHRSHFYQFLANEKKLPHLTVAIIYGMTQLLINIAIVNTANRSMFSFALYLTGSMLLFFCIRFLLEGKEHLLMNKFTQDI